MNCDALRERLAAYLDGEVTDEEKKLLDEHLTSCVACRREWEELKSLARLTREELGVKAPAGLGAAVLEACQGETAGREAVAHDASALKVTDDMARESRYAEESEEESERTGQAVLDHDRVPRMRVIKGWRWSWRVGAPALAAAAVLLIALTFRWSGRGSESGPEAPFTKPAALVVLRYGDAASPAGVVVTTEPELGGLDLGDM